MALVIDGQIFTEGEENKEIKKSIICSLLSLTGEIISHQNVHNISFFHVDEWTWEVVIYLTYEGSKECKTIKYNCNFNYSIDEILQDKADASYKEHLQDLAETEYQKSTIK